MGTIFWGMGIVIFLYFGMQVEITSAPIVPCVNVDTYTKFREEEYLIRPVKTLVRPNHPDYDPLDCLQTAQLPAIDCE